MFKGRMVFGVISLLLISGAGYGSLSAAELQPFSGLYKLTSGSMTVGELELSLSLTETGGYRYLSKSRPTGFIGKLVGGRIEEQSSGTVSAATLQPLHYRYRREGRKVRTVALRFDWNRLRVVNTINDDPWVMSIEPETVDKLSVQLLLMRDLQAGKREMEYSVADGGTLKIYRFFRGEDEVLKSPVGELKTIRVKRDRGRKDRYTEFWCAPRLGYLPVRIIQYRDGEEHARMILHRIDPQPQLN